MKDETIYRYTILWGTKLALNVVRFSAYFVGFFLWYIGKVTTLYYTNVKHSTIQQQWQPSMER